MCIVMAASICHVLVAWIASWHKKSWITHKKGNKEMDVSHYS